MVNELTASIAGGGCNVPICRLRKKILRLSQKPADGQPFFASSPDLLLPLPGTRRRLQILSSAQTLSLDHFKVAAFGAEVDGFFSQQQIASQLETEGVDDPVIQDKVQETLRNLKQEEVDRLIYVGTLPNSCEFSRPSAKVKRCLDIDRQLSKKGFVEIKPDPVAYTQVKKKEKIQRMARPPPVTK